MLLVWLKIFSEQSKLQSVTGMAKFQGEGPQITDWEQPQNVDWKIAEKYYLFYSRISTTVQRKGGEQRNAEDSSCHQTVPASVLSPVPQTHYFVKKDFSSLLEIQSKIKLKRNLVGVNLVIGNKQLGIGKVNYLCLLTYSPQEER